jgi:hypothetical protein
MQVIYSRQVFLRPPSVNDGGQNIRKDARSFLAGGAFAAAVECLHPPHIFGGHGRHVHIPVIKDDAVPSHEGGKGPFTVVRYRQTERRILQVAAQSVVDYISSPTGKNHLRHLSPHVNRPKNTGNPLHLFKKQCQKIVYSMRVLA